MPELQIEHAAGLFHKTKFSMVVPEVETLMSRLCNGNVRHVVLFGIEVTHSQNIYTVEPLLYDHPQNHIGVVVFIRGMVAREGFIYFALLQ